MRILLLFLLSTLAIRAQVISTTVAVNTNIVLLGRSTNFFRANLNYADLPNMAALRALSITTLTDGAGVNVLGYYTPGDGGGATYVLTNSITGTNAYGGKVVALGGAKSWLLSTDGSRYMPQWFGAIPNDGLDDLANIHAMRDFAGATPMVFPKGDFDLSDTAVFQPNTALGIGRSGHTIEGSVWGGTGAVTNAASFEHTRFVAHHVNPIVQYAGVNGGIKNLDFIYGTWEASTNQTAHCLLFAGNNTVMCTFENLRFYNGYRSIFAQSDGYQLFSSIFRNIFILGFYNAAFELQQPGTQGIFENIYITPAAPAGAAPINSEVSLSITNVGNFSTFELTTNYASVFDAGELVLVSGCDNAALNGNHSIVDVGVNYIVIEWQSLPSPLPTVATISKNGGSAVIDGYVIRCSQYREDEWINLNVEWVRCKNGQGLLFGDRTTILGLHLEGISFSSETFANGIWVRSYGPLTINGWDLFNSLVATNQTWSVFGPGTTNSSVTLFGGRMRDQYYNPGSTLAICGQIADLPEDSLYYDNYSTWNTTRWNRTGVFNGVNYAKKFVGAVESTGKVTIGTNSAGNVLALKGGASGVRMVTMDRTGVDLIGLSSTTDGLSIFNETDGRGIAQITGSSSDVALTMGTLYTATSPNITIQGADTTIGTNITSGTLSIRAPSGTGDASGGGTIGFATPNAGASGATTQTDTTKVTISKLGDLILNASGQGVQIGNSGPKILAGTATPEAAVTAEPGSIYMRNNGGTGELWAKTSGTGNTGWVQITIP